MDKLTALETSTVSSRSCLISVPVSDGNGKHCVPKRSLQIVNQSGENPNNL